MQQTSLDRWLKETFVYETHVYVLSAPPWLPPGVKLEPQEITIKNRFKYKMVIRKRKDLEKALQALVDSTQTYATRVESRGGLAAALFDARDGGSFTWKVVRVIFGLVLLAMIFYYVPWDQIHRLGEAFDFIKKYL